LNGRNLLFGDIDLDAAVEIGATVSISDSCSDQDLDALPNVSVTDSSRASGNPTELALSLDAFLIPFSGCVNRGNNVVATATFLPEDWQTQTTRLDTILDFPNVDPGVHRNPSQDLWIEALAIDAVNASWTGNFPSGTTCDHVVIQPGPNEIGTLSSAEVDLGFFVHGSLFAPTAFQFSCTFQGNRVASEI
jgi:hypothetical protein